MFQTILTIRPSKSFHPHGTLDATSSPAIRPPMNQFDLAIALGLAAFMGLGFYSGFLRSLASILGYVAAAPIAVEATSYVSPALAGNTAPPWARNFALFFVVLLVAGLVVGRLLRHGLDELIGDDVGIADRVVGALLGATRVGLVAVPVVVMFDRYVPADRQPQFFAGSKLRSYFSAAGQRGIDALPADATAYLDRLSRQRRG
jgi:membrane protein required for colicin V production